MFSYWEQKEWHTFDTVIVGGGFTGLHSALSIKSRFPDQRIAIVERLPIGSAASTRNAGFACFGSATELLADLQHMPEKDVVDLVRQRFEGIELLHQRCSSSDMHFNRFGGFELLEEHQLEVLNELDRLNTMLAPVFNQPVFSNRPDLVERFGFNANKIKTLIYNPFEGQLDPYALWKSLCNQAREAGIALLQGVTVTSVGSGTPGEIHLSTGDRLTAKEVVLATNAFTDELTEAADHQPGRGQVIVTEPIDGLPFKGTFHWDEGYYYFRNFENRVVFGGGRNMAKEEETTTAMELNSEIIRALELRLHEDILPGRRTRIDYKWSGIMAFGETKKPQVTRNNDGCIVAAGLNGMGVALSARIGEQVADLINTHL